MLDHLTAERVREVLDYDPLTGAFRWRIARGRCAAGTKAGAAHNHGYVSIHVDGHGYLAHRLAWLYVRGEWPLGWLDHIDGDRANNVFANIRAASPTQNQANRKATRGRPKGVTIRRASKKFHARIRVGGGREMALGRYDTFEQAHAAYMAAAREHFGEFARAA